jgi:hypothetical protein
MWARKLFNFDLCTSNREASECRDFDETDNNPIDRDRITHEVASRFPKASVGRRHRESSIVGTLGRFARLPQFTAGFPSSTTMPSWKSAYFPSGVMTKCPPIGVAASPPPGAFTNFVSVAFFSPPGPSRFVTS